MVKPLLLGAVLLALSAGLAMSQSLPPGDPGSDSLRANHVTTTGQTVPNPGASQSSGVTPLDQGIQREDTRIQGSICKGC